MEKRAETLAWLKERVQDPETELVAKWYFLGDACCVVGLLCRRDMILTPADFAGELMCEAVRELPLHIIDKLTTTGLTVDDLARLQSVNDAPGNADEKRRAMLTEEIDNLMAQEG